MRDSYSASDINAVVIALREGEAREDNRFNTIVADIQNSLLRLLNDSETPERTWRQKVSVPLHALAELMRLTGKPTPSVERLASELSY